MAGDVNCQFFVGFGLILSIMAIDRMTKHTGIYSALNDD